MGCQIDNTAAIKKMTWKLDRGKFQINNLLLTPIVQLKCDFISL